MQENKQKMSEEERLQLAAKLDKDLDDFINSLPKREPQENQMPMTDEWIEELQSHPFFMKKIPEPGEKMHPLYEGLQKLKYDPEENEPLDLAIAYKDDGNFNFKHKNYRLAILSYTEGIKANCNDNDVQATLYNNRAASNYFLKNYRSSLRDCEMALKYQPNYTKSIIRAANCCYEMKSYEKGVEYCDKILNSDKNNKEMQEIRKKCVTSAKLKERNERKMKSEAKKRELEEEMLIKEIKNRGITIDTGKGGITLENLEPCVPQLAQNRVYINTENNLIWPVVFMYPEIKLMDYIQEFNEKQIFSDQLQEVFAEPPEWDDKKVYKPQNLIIYFESQKNKLIEVDTTQTLGEILKNKDYIVKAGTPGFIILVKDSFAHKKFLESY